VSFSQILREIKILYVKKIIDLLGFDVYLPNSHHKRIQIICHVDKFTLWHKERILDRGTANWAICMRSGGGLLRIKSWELGIGQPHICWFMGLYILRNIKYLYRVAFIYHCEKIGKRLAVNTKPNIFFCSLSTYWVCRTRVQILKVCNN